MKRFLHIGIFIRIVVAVSAVWLPIGGWYMVRGMKRQRLIGEVLEVYRDPDAAPQKIQEETQLLLDRGDPYISLLYLVQELNQEEHRYANMRLCRGLSQLLARRQEHAAGDAAGRLLDATFMWPHVRYIPDLVVQLKKPVIEQPVFRKRVDDLVKRLRGLCLQREVDFSANQRQRLDRGAAAVLADDEASEEDKALAAELRALLARTQEDEPLPQTFRTWRGLTLAAAKVRGLAGVEEEAAQILADKVAKNGPQSSFIVGGNDQKILGNTLKHLQSREAKWHQKRGVMSSTLRFEPTSMEQLERYVSQVERDGILEPWQRELLDPFAAAAAGNSFAAPAAALKAWREAEALRGEQIESLCAALEALRAGKAKLTGVTRQAALFCVAGWEPRNGLEGASEDTALTKLQDFLWGDTEWLPAELAESPSVVEEVCQSARASLAQASALRAALAAGAPLTAGQAAYLNAQAQTWSQVAKLPEILAEIVDGETKPLATITSAQREFMALKCLHLQSRYRRSRDHVAKAAELFTKKVVDLAGGKFGRRTQGEEVNNLRAIALIWKQRDEEMLAGDLVRLLSNEFAEVRTPVRRALVYIGRAAIPPIEELVTRREINQIMAVETAELSKDDHTKLLESQLRTGRAEAGLCLAAIGANLVAENDKSGSDPDEDPDVLRVRRALHSALGDARSGLEELKAANLQFRADLTKLGLLGEESAGEEAKP